MVESSQMDALIASAVRYMTILEETTNVTDVLPQGERDQMADVCAPAPCRSHTLWRPTGANETILWGRSVEWLWSAAMAMQERCTEWETLTARLLVWRAIAGETSDVAEWARREVIRNIC